MPELPEVETIVRELRENIVGQIIKEVVLSKSKLRVNYSVDFINIAQNRQILNIKRCAKYIFITLSGGWVIIVHLGMSGRLTTTDLVLCNKHNHVIWCFKNRKYLVFSDPRRFGLVIIVRDDTINKLPFIQNLGIEPLSNEFNTDVLSTLIKNKKCSIKATIMDSSIVVGIGNIYASESLFYAGIRPTRIASTLSDAEIDKLVNSIKYTLNYAINSKGATLKDYRTSHGISGGFQNSFKVYGRVKQPCYDCNDQIFMVRISGRSSFYCPKCQS